MTAENNELKRKLDESPSDGFNKTFERWINLPLYIIHEDGSEEDIRLKALAGSNPTSEIEGFLGEMRTAVGAKRKEGNYQEALEMVAHYYEKATLRFQGDELITIARKLYYRAGYVLEHRATYGDLATLPLTDPKRIDCFLCAARFYMESDLVLGVATDYGLRVGESLFGAGENYGRQGVLSIKKILGGPIEVIGSDDKSGQVVVQDLERRAKKEGPKVPGGGKTSFVSSEDLPQGNNN